MKYRRLKNNRATLYSGSHGGVYAKIGDKHYRVAAKAGPNEGKPKKRRRSNSGFSLFGL